jgi:hypothetical protein
MKGAIVCGFLKRKRQFVQDPHQTIIDKVTKHLIDKSLLENVPLAGIARVAAVSEIGL